MKKLLISFTLIAAALTACNSNKMDQARDNHQMGDHSMMDSGMKHMDNAPMQNHQSGSKENNSIAPVLTSYLRIKSALAEDDSRVAASAGKEVAEAIQKIDAANLSAEQKKIYNEVKDDMKEHGEHIGANADKIAHQREHFETLSKDMYDLSKVFTLGTPVYYTHCPMYNDNKGAHWLSESKEIKNPYLGKKMYTCGTVKEEL